MTIVPRRWSVCTARIIYLFASSFELFICLLMTFSARRVGSFRRKLTIVLANEIGTLFHFVAASSVADIMRTPGHSLVTWLIGTSLLVTLCHADSEEPPCFMVTSASCAEIDSESKCQLSKDHAQIFCCNVTSEGELVQSINKKVLNRKCRFRGLIHIQGVPSSLQSL